MLSDRSPTNWSPSLLCPTRADPSAPPALLEMNGGGSRRSSGTSIQRSDHGSYDHGSAPDYAVEGLDGRGDWRKGTPDCAPGDDASTVVAVSRRRAVDASDLRQCALVHTKMKAWKTSPG